MTMLRHVLTLASWVFLLHGCVTIAGAHSGVPLDVANQPLPATRDAQQPSLQISADELTHEASPYLGVVEVTFENPTSAWQEIDAISLDFGSVERNEKVVVPWGAPLNAWADAVVAREAIRLQNTSGDLRADFFGGALRRRDRYAANGGDRPEAGGLLSIDALNVLASAPAEAALAPAANATATDRAPRHRFPDHHLLMLPIRVPPGLFAKRWIVLYTAAPSAAVCIDRVVLSYRLSDQTRGKVLLPFKETSEWQKQSCWGYAAKVG